MLDIIFSDLRQDEQIYVFKKSLASPHQRLLFDTPQEVITYAMQNAKEADLYFGVSPRVRGSFDQVSRVTCAYADIDGIDGKKVTEDTLADRVAMFPVKPSIIVVSGHGLHVYWMYTEALPGEEAQRISKGIMTVIGSDAVHDPERILRIPGTTNWKDPNNPHPVVLRGSFPERRYAPKDLLAMTKLNVSCLNTIRTGSDGGFKTRSERDWNILRNMIACGLSDEAIRAIAEQRPVGERWREDNFRLLDLDLKKAKSSYAEGDQRFTSAHGSLFYNGQKGQHQVATFIFKPQRVLRSEDTAEDALYGTIETQDRHWDGVIFPRSAFSSVGNFMKLLTAMEWQWLGSDYETKQYLLHLMGQVKALDIQEATSTYVVGRHEDYWVTKTVTLGKNEVYQPEKSPYLYTDRKNRRRDTVDTVPSTLYTFPDLRDYQDLLRNMAYLLPKLNVRESIIPLIGWFMAAPLRSVFHNVGVRFPLLNVFGTMGSGKTSLIANVLMPMLGVTEHHVHASSTTRFVLRMLLSQTNGIPVTFGEYRESSIDARSDLHGLLRMLYDTGMDSRGHADQSTETYLLESPVIVDGEDALSDPALKQRSIVINLHPEHVEEGTTYSNAYKTLIEFPIADFAGYYIQRTLCVGVADAQQMFNHALKRTKDAFDLPLPDRVRNNLAVVTAGLTLLNQHLEEHQVDPIEWEMADLQGCIDNVIMRLSTGSSRTMVDDFIEDTVSFVANAQNTRVPFITFYSKETNVLWIHFTSAHQWWTKEQKYRGRTNLEAQAMQTQLGERSRDREGYVVPLSLIETAPGQRIQMYGIRLTQAFNAGLAVPDSISSDTLVSKWGMTLKSATNSARAKIPQL